MNREEFGKLIVALRKEKFDSQQKPWSREKLAEEAQLDFDTLSTIETGSRKTLTSEILNDIATALNLTAGERLAFFGAAACVEEKHLNVKLSDPAPAFEHCISLMENLQQPALLVDDFFDVVAIKWMTMELYNITPDHFTDSSANPVTRANVMRFFFGSEFANQRAMFRDTWDSFALNLMAVFDVITLPHRGKETFKTLREALFKLQDFRTYAERKQKVPRQNLVENQLRIHLENKDLGTVDCVTSSVTAHTTGGNLNLFILNPLNAETARLFSNLANNERFTFQVLPKWPQKPQK